MDLPKTILYEEIHRGLINVVFYKRRMRISFREMREYAATIGKEFWHLPDLGEYGYVGLPFRSRARNQNAPYCHDLQTYCRNYRGYDGALYIAPSAYMTTDPKLLEFVCRTLFRYNQLMIRRRPFSKRRFVFLCFTDGKTKKKAEELKRTVEQVIPGILKVEPFEYVMNTRSI